MRAKPNRITIANAVRLSGWITEHKETITKLTIGQAAKRASEDLDLNISISSFRTVSKDLDVTFKRKTSKLSTHSTRETRLILLEICKAIFDENHQLTERAQKLFDLAFKSPSNS